MENRARSSSPPPVNPKSRCKSRRQRLSAPPTSRSVFDVAIVNATSRPSRWDNTSARHSRGSWSSPIAREARSEVNQRAGSWFDEMKSRGGVSRGRAQQISARPKSLRSLADDQYSSRPERILFDFTASPPRSTPMRARGLTAISPGASIRMRAPVFDSRAHVRLVFAASPLRRLRLPPARVRDRLVSPRSTFERPSSEKPRDYEQDVQAHPRYGQPRRVGISSLRRPHREG